MTDQTERVLSALIGAAPATIGALTAAYLAWRARRDSGKAARESFYRDLRLERVNDEQLVHLRLLQNASVLQRSTPPEQSPTTAAEPAHEAK